MAVLNKARLAGATGLPGAVVAAVAVLALAGCGSAATSPASNDQGPGATAAAPATGGASGGPSTAGSTGGTLDSCKLVTQEEAAAVLGVAVRAPLSNAGGLACVYLPVSGSVPELSVNAVQGAGAGVDRAGYGAAALALADKVDVSGLGDAAFSSGGGRNITFLKGSTVVSITVQAADQSINYSDKLMTAAQAAVGRIK